MKPALCAHKYTYPLDERGADILVRYTHQIIEGTDVVTLTGIEADSSALAGIKDDMFSTDNDHLLKDLADDLVFSATFRKNRLLDSAARLRSRPATGWYPSNQRSPAPCRTKPLTSRSKHPTSDLTATTS